MQVLDAANKQRLASCAGVGQMKLPDLECLKPLQRRLSYLPAQGKRPLQDDWPNQPGLTVEKMLNSPFISRDKWKTKRTTRLVEIPPAQIKGGIAYWTAHGKPLTEIYDETYSGSRGSINQ